MKFYFLLVPGSDSEEGENARGGNAVGIVKEKNCLFIRILIMIPFLFAMTGCSKTSKDIEDYLNTGTQIDEDAKDIMPPLENLSEYEEIEYRYTNKTMFIFESNSVALIVKYDNQTYEDEKERLAENYIFLNQKNTSDTIDETIIPEFLINSYTFNVVKGNGQSHTQFPKSFGMIGTSDEKQSIAYLYFYDFDLDSIGDEGHSNPMEYFVKEYFNYDF